jgi:hypothetical protein
MGIASDILKQPREKAFLRARNITATPAMPVRRLLQAEEEHTQQSPQ